MPTMNNLHKVTTALTETVNAQPKEENSCTVCGINLDDKNYCFRDGKFYCEPHYQQLFFRLGAPLASLVSSSLSSLESSSKDRGASNGKSTNFLDVQNLSVNHGVSENDSSSSEEDGEDDDQDFLLRHQGLLSAKTSVEQADERFRRSDEDSAPIVPISIPIPVLPIRAAQLNPSGPHCAQCGSIVEAGICIVDRYYHPKCFVCTECKRRIKLPKYAITEGNLYCVKHFKKLLTQWKPSEEKPDQKPDAIPELTASNVTSSPVQRERMPPKNPVYCAACGMQLHESIFRNGKHYHPDCVDCALCNRTAGTGRFAARGSQIYCSEHAEKKHKDKAAKQQDEPLKVHKRTNSSRKPGPQTSKLTIECVVCSQPIEGGMVVDGKSYHPWCFRCSRCHKKLRLKGYQLLEGVPVCLRRTCKPGAGSDKESIDNAIELIHVEQHNPVRHNLLQNVVLTSPCAVCDFPTEEGYCVLGKVYHPACFKCSDCGKQLTLKKCRIVQGAFYCPKDCRRITGTARSLLQNIKSCVKT